MTTQIQFVNMPESDYVRSVVEKKMEKLGKKYSWINSARVSIRQQKTSTNKDKICEIDLSVPGPKLFVKAQEEGFEQAVGAAFLNLESVLKKRKAKMYSH